MFVYILLNGVDVDGFKWCIQFAVSRASPLPPESADAVVNTRNIRKVYLMAYPSKWSGGTISLPKKNQMLGSIVDQSMVIQKLKAIL